MRKDFCFILGTITLLGCGATAAAQGHSERFRAHNAEMSTLQPALISPLVAPDPRLLQYARFSVSHEFTSSGAETVNWGNCRGGGVIVRKRFELDWAPPVYLQHNGHGADGWGDTSLLAKYRIASGNAEAGNFEVTAIVSRTLATGSHSNGGVTGSYTPVLAAGYARGHFDVIGSVGGTLPTGENVRQGRSVAWNTTVQMHATRHIWMEMENNATFYKGGSHDGAVQNFATPAVFYVVRKKEWKALHPWFIVDGGMQVATSSFHTYNHNIVTELRMLF